MDARERHTCELVQQRFLRASNTHVGALYNSTIRLAAAHERPSWNGLNLNQRPLLCVLGRGSGRGRARRGVVADIDGDW